MAEIYADEYLEFITASAEDDAADDSLRRHKQQGSTAHYSHHASSPAFRVAPREHQSSSVSLRNDVASRLPDRAAVKNYFRELFPPLEWVSQYNLVKFRGDLIAGMTLTVMLIPQSVAYALLAGLTPEYGIYSCSLPLFVYALFGTSRQLNVGPVALVSLITSETLSNIGLKTCDVVACHSAPPATDLLCQVCTQTQQTYSEAAITMALLSGLMQLVLGLLHLGVLASFLSQPVVIGFNLASAVLIAASQLKSVFGVKVPSMPTVFETIYECFKVAFYDRKINWPALVVWLVATVMLYVVQRFNQRFKPRVPVPGPLIVVIIGTLVSYLMQLQTPIVGTLPEIFPKPAVPSLAVYACLHVVLVLYMLVV
jgi:MFS superfamily sulfate permease-like transporter